MRYAIYLTPPDGSSLAAAAEAWLGRSAFTGATRTAAAPVAARPDVPARYGFHATLKAPFALAPDASPADILVAFERHCDAAPPVEATLAVSALAGFLALTAVDETDVHAAGERAVRAFEPFRAPTTDADRARRGVEALDARGRELVDAWGYPYVLERFKFHMTLTGPLADEAADAVRVAAAKHFAAELGRPQRLVHALFREDEAGGPFAIIATQRSDGPL